MQRVFQFKNIGGTFWRKASLLYLFCLVVILWSCPSSAMASGSSLYDLRENRILRQWKESASDTKNGTKLLNLLENCDRKIKHNSTDKKSLYQRGYLYGTIGCTSSAIHDLSKAIEIDPYYSAAYTERGICYIDSHLYQRALNDLNRALVLDSWSADARFARAKLLLLMNRPREAERDLKACSGKAFKFRPALPGELSGNYYNASHYYLGKVYEKQGRRFDALREYRKYAESSGKVSYGYLHRYSDKPLDTRSRVKRLGYKL